MAQRPESVTVIAWLLIVFGGFGLMGCLVGWTMKDWPMMQPIIASYKVAYPIMLGAALASLSIYMLCAVGLLLRQGWARHVYLVTAFSMIGFSTWATPWPQFVLPSLIFPVVATMFLYRPAANRWFAGEDGPAAT